MNTNKKHKSKNKSKSNSNTSTGEKVELTAETEQQDIKQVSAVIENVSKEESGKEVISENVGGTSDKEAEPKKPKRNKNKKKQEQDGVAIEKTETQDSNEKNKLFEKKLDIETEEPSNDDFITPTARKKKNKHKKGETQSEVNTDKVVPEKEDVKQKQIETEDKNKGQDIATSPVPGETKNDQQNKSGKKKNKKKKNRNDSERSDKSEEIISCTAAFQQLLDVKTEKQETAPEAEAKNIQHQKFEDVKPIEPEAKNKTDDDIQKGKKKNKKGKSVIQPDDNQQKQVEPEKNTENVQTKETTEVIENKQTESELFCEVTGITKMPSPKPKAKIAKPVEKKNEGKSDESDLLSPTIQSKTVNVLETEESAITKTETEKEVVPKIFTDLPEAIKEEPKIITSNPHEIKPPKKKEDQVNKLDKSSLQDKVALSQIFNEKPEEASLKTDDIIEPDKLKEVESTNLAFEEPKARISKTNRKNKNKTDVKAADIKSPVSLPESQEETIDKPLQEKKEKSIPASTEDTLKKEMPLQGIDNLKNIIKHEIKGTELIMHHSAQAAQATTTADNQKQTEETLQITPIDKRRQKSPAKRENKDIKEQSDERTKPDIVFESKSDQKKEVNLQVIELMAPEIKTSDEGCQLKETKNIVEVEKLSKDLIETSTSHEDLHVPTHKNKKRKKSPKPPPGRTETVTHIENMQIDKIESIKQQVPEHISQSESDKKPGRTETVTHIENMPIDKIESIKQQVPEQISQSESEKKPGRTETVTHIESIPIDKIESIKQQVPEQISESESDKKPTIVQPSKDAENTKLPENVPDSIHYARSLSHSIADSNNNASIREIKTPNQFSIGLFEVPHTEIIEGSGASPTTTEIKLPNIQGPQITEVSGTEKEKNDLKSKVLEVNNDMEVLRLSIERSLAELTCLEQKELEVEKPPETIENKSVSEEILQKQEIAAKSETELKKTSELCQGPSTVSTLTGNVEIRTQEEVSSNPPVCPARQDKGKGKSKKKNKQDTHQTTSSSQTAQQSVSSAASSGTTSESNLSQGETKEGEKTEKKNDTKQEKGKQSDGNEKHHAEDSKKDSVGQQESTDKADSEPIYSTINKAFKVRKDNTSQTVTDKQGLSEKPTNAKHGDFEPIDNFEDAMTSSMDDVNKSFEIIASENNTVDEKSNPAISITAPEEDTQKRDEKDKINPVSQPKNLLGHTDIPVPSNRNDYKKEKNKTPNARHAKVKLKDSVEIEPAKAKESKESQTDSKKKLLKKDTIVEESVPCLTNENEEYVYKYSFRKVFLPNVCHICKKELKTIRVPCNFCSLMFYCSEKHKNEGWQQHQGLCFAVSTVAHNKGQKHIYAESKNLTGHEYRLFRMQTILACEKVLKRKLVAWEQEVLLYPRICADPSCREFRQSKLKDCDGCGQIFFCANSPEHLPKTHQRWCKSYNLYHKLVHHQQTRGRLAPRLPTKVLAQAAPLPDKINMVLATLYEERIDMNDIQYAALTQIATAPLTAAYSYQLYSRGNPAVTSKSTFTIHIVGAELQYEADALNKWETLFLHLHPEVMKLDVVMVCAHNPSDLPLDLLGKVKLCANCRLHSRRLVFHFQDKKSYYEYWDCSEFLTPDIVCAFNPSIHRSAVYNGKDQWPHTISTIFKQKCPFLITSYTMNELNRDLNRISECSTTAFRVLAEAKFNPFASVRPDRNFITDDEIPLLFKNFCFAVLCHD